MAPESENTPELTRWIDEELITAAPESVAQLEEMVTEVGRSPSLWRHAVSFETERWTRRVLYKTSRLEIVLFGWAVGQETAFHDHGGASGAAFVCRGTLVEDRAEPAGDGRFQERTYMRRPGSAFGFGPADVHRVRHDPDEGPAISIHAYATAPSDSSDYELLPDGSLRVLDPDRELQPA